MELGHIPRIQPGRILVPHEINCSLTHSCPTLLPTESEAPSTHIVRAYVEASLRVFPVLRVFPGASRFPALRDFPALLVGSGVYAASPLRLFDDGVTYQLLRTKEIAFSRRFAFPGALHFPGASRFPIRAIRLSWRFRRYFNFNHNPGCFGAAGAV